MYATLIFFHSVFRWLVLISLIYAIFRAWRGYTTNTLFTKTDHAIRQWTVNFIHIQFVIGFTLYLTSPIIKSFYSNVKDAIRHVDMAFFGIAHILCMFVAVALISVGSGMVKRKPSDQEKFKAMLLWFSIALLIIFIAIPWPFSPLANRPYLRAF
jgi:drug/metabolite transporter (DMT)-like permease